MVKPIIRFSIFELKSLFITSAFNIPGVITFCACLPAKVEEITIPWIVGIVSSKFLVIAQIIVDNICSLKLYTSSECDNSIFLILAFNFTRINCTPLFQVVQTKTDYMYFN